MRYKAIITSLLTLLLASCARNLTPNEAAFLGTVHGNNISYKKMKIVEGGVQNFRKGTGAMAIGNTIHYNRSNYREDFIPTGPGEVSYINDRILLAHEATHIWQYQNIQLTGCSLNKIISEHNKFGDNVYDYPHPLSSSKKFLSYRCEQQAEIVGDWVKLREYTDPMASIYEQIIRKAMPVDKLIHKISAVRPVVTQ